MRTTLYFIFLLATLTVLSSCKKKTKDEDTFIKIYDEPDGNKRYFPIAIAPSSSNDGYIVLSARNGWNIHLMKIDLTGELLWKRDLPDNYVNAVPSIIQQNGQNYLVCMDAVGLFTYLLKIDESIQNITEVTSFSSILYPTYACKTGNALYIQNYNRTSYQTEIHRISADFSSIEQSGAINILTDVEEKIVNHISYLGKRIPFSVTTTKENNYVVMNGFNNYSFSLIFLNPDLTVSGVYNGAGFNGGVAALSSLGSNQFAVAKFDYDHLYLSGKTPLNPTTIDITASISAQGNPELDSNKPVVFKDITVNGTAYTACLSSTRSNQLLLQFFEKSSGSLAGKKYLGKNVPITGNDFIQTLDEGISIVAQVKIMGSFDRIALMKLSKDQLNEIID